MSEEILAFRLSATEQKLERVTQHVAEMEAKFAARETERQKDEKRRLYSALMFLGTIIMTLVGYLWNTLRGDV